MTGFEIMTARSHAQAGSFADNAIARDALEAIQRIEAEAKQKKLAQRESLEQTRTTILDRIKELNHQLAQVDGALAMIDGKKPAQPKPVSGTEKKPRRNWDEVRERVLRWMEERKGEKFHARDLAREFPELEGQQVSLFLKPLRDVLAIRTDKTEGVQNVKYYVV
ncbi:MAG: hypothetical protein FWD61_02735 [Phycisphaerales bacterium]|nr:hypothetical protein [Phycisphaerales bacterium]